MPSDQTFRKLRVFLACPSDVADEKQRLEKVIQSLQSDADRQGFVVELLEWRQCLPDIGLPQEKIFEQLSPAAWDIFIGILWARFGSPSGIRDRYSNRELTGTGAELLEAIRLYRLYKTPRILIYRSVRAPKSLRDVQGAQLKEVERFFKDCEAAGKHPALVKEYEEPDEFERLVSEHLRTELAKLGTFNANANASFQRLEEVARSDSMVRFSQLIEPLFFDLERVHKNHLDACWKLAQGLEDLSIPITRLKAQAEDMRLEMIITRQRSFAVSEALASAPSLDPKFRSFGEAVIEYFRENTDKIWGPPQIDPESQTGYFGLQFYLEFALAEIGIDTRKCIADLIRQDVKPRFERLWQPVLRAYAQLKVSLS